jgi:hypothetical protein
MPRGRKSFCFGLLGKMVVARRETAVIRSEHDLGLGCEEVVARREKACDPQPSARPTLTREHVASISPSDIASAPRRALSTHSRPAEVR